MFIAAGIDASTLSVGRQVHKDTHANMSNGVKLRHDGYAASLLISLYH